GQKTGFVLLLVFALLAVGLTFLQMRNTIYSPFVIHISREEIEAREAFEFDETTRLQQIDTDQDGLNDYEELFFYETSRYLPDTDSDGLDDKTEIDGGTNTLCPEGQACGVTGFDDLSTSTDPIISPLLEKSNTASDILLESQFNGGGLNAPGTPDINTMISDPAVLRQMLISTGQVSEEDLSEISDEQLMAMAQQLAQDQFSAPPAEDVVSEEDSNLEDSLPQ
ncbi:hypothetical protein C0581_04220, partial [Candidatus Parcubacteria bacterium]